jgi:tetratricopeptide (TPR) repeat protein
LEKLPFVVVSALFVVVAIAARRQSLLVVEQSNAPSSLALACYAVWFYLSKTIVPLNLNVVYPAPEKTNWLEPRFFVAIMGTIGITLGLYLARRRCPGLLAGWLSYLIILAPNSGIVQINDQIAGDRYSYLSMMGLAVVFAGCVCWLWERMERARVARAGLIAVGAGLVLILIFMTRDQCRTWRTSGSLWAHALSHGAADSAVAHFNLGLILYRDGKLDPAAQHFREALRLKPGDASAYNSLGVVLQRQGKLDAAAECYTAALRLDRNSVDAHYNLGVVLSRQQKFDAAAVHYREALRVNPALARAHNNLGSDLFQQGHLMEAEAQYNKALALEPADANTHANLAIVLSRLGKTEAAADHRAKALRLGVNTGRSTDSSR